MAHSCPDCGSVCYCNGDIDEILYEGADDVETCTCCEGLDEDDADDDWDDA